MNARARLVVVSAVAALLSALAVMVLAPNLNLTQTRTVEAIPNANLVPPWKLHVTVENGNGDISWTRTVASRIGAMGYTIAKVGRADRFDYPSSTVYYGPGGHDDRAAARAPARSRRAGSAGPRTDATCSRSSGRRPSRRRAERGRYASSGVRSAESFAFSSSDIGSLIATRT